MRQAHAAIFGSGGDPCPTALRPCLVNVAKARRRPHAAILVGRALKIAYTVERRDLLGREAARLLDDRSGGRGVKIAELAFIDRLAKAGHVLKRKQNVGDRRPISHKSASSA